MKKINVVLTSLLLSSSVVAQEYNLFSELNYTRAEVGQADADILGVSSIYYFDKKAVLGPLAELSYINDKTNVYGAYIDSEGGVNDLNIGGELFYNNFLFGAEYNRAEVGSDDFDSSTVTLGYLINPNFLVKADYTDLEHGGFATFGAQYTHSLGGVDYVGFSLNVDDEFDVWTASSKYFSALGEDRFIAAELSVTDNDGDTDWGISGDYYFTTMTSVGLSYADEASDDVWGINAKHYFNTNWAVSAAYASADENDADIYSISLIGQF
ncbi:putative porin [Bowmanella sp. Y26]|uniref:putative porin n=1 Tax=Bowmanella yangjiangensis TaxID=2811230 RepID=UPI001BDC3460|nr:putative porin [Bowmanella yangjiangensis]MBT1062537.1 putative porin [Bowmanella yangjiangensis]